MGNNNTEERQFISKETKIGKFDISVPIKPASKTNWLYHCLGIGVDKQDGDAAGNNNSANSFVTDGTKSNCAEASGGCVALGNTLAAFIGLYYYPECNQADNNWVVTQARNSHTYNVRMRMWNPRYELQHTTYKNSVEVEVGVYGRRRLLVREPLNDMYGGAAYVGSHPIANGTMHVDGGFLLRPVYRSVAADISEKLVKRSTPYILNTRLATIVLTFYA